jgi:hypothetical protein
VDELYRLLEAGKRAAGVKGEIDTTPFGREQNRACLELLMKYCVQQKLVPGPIGVDQLW